MNQRLSICSALLRRTGGGGRGEGETDVWEASTGMNANFLSAKSSFCVPKKINGIKELFASFMHRWASDTYLWSNSHDRSDTADVLLETMNSAARAE
jgi:hypothetical protein